MGKLTELDNIIQEAIAEGETAASKAQPADQTAASIDVLPDHVLLQGDSCGVMQQLLVQGYAGAFQCIYLDPPFHHGTEKEALNIIFENDLLKDDGIIIVETDKKDEVECKSPYYVEKSAVYGINKVTYIRKEHQDAESYLSGII